jgi:hypothetical protein
MPVDEINPPIRWCSRIITWRNDLPSTLDLMDGIDADLRIGGGTPHR